MRQHCVVGEEPGCSPPWRARLTRSVLKTSCLFCALDPGNLKFETLRTHKQHIYLLLGFETLNLKFGDLKL